MRRNNGSYHLTDNSDMDAPWVSAYDPKANRFKVHFNFIAEKWLYIISFKKYLRHFVKPSEINVLVKEMKQNLRKENSGYR